MDLFIRFVGILFVLAGLPLFLVLVSILIGYTALVPPLPDRFIEEAFLVYIGCGVSGLLSASGLALIALARMAYPIKKK